ncbi:MAG: hypothetical protein AAF228_14125 [Pseudomonadota bacterium]
MSTLPRDILTHPLYAGYVHRPDWGINFIKAKHEPLICFETYQKIQNRMTATAHAPARSDIHCDFPLRGFVTCAGCEKPMTAAWVAREV